MRGLSVSEGRGLRPSLRCLSKKTAIGLNTAWPSEALVVAAPIESRRAAWRGPSGSGAPVAWLPSARKNARRCGFPRGRERGSTLLARRRRLRTRAVNNELNVPTLTYQLGNLHNALPQICGSREKILVRNITPKNCSQVHIAHVAQT